jgi:hypothetical protein
LLQAFINGLPTEADPEKWEPIVQNHFVSAGSVPVLSNSNALMVSADASAAAAAASGAADVYCLRVTLMQLLHAVEASHLP